MIKNLCMVVTEDAKGKLKVAYLGDNRGASLKAFDEAIKDGKLQSVVAIRNPRYERRKFPSKKADIRSEREQLAQAQAEADEADRLAAEQEATETAARGHASLAAIELADENGIGIAGIVGTGEGGRVITADVQAAIDAASAPASP